MAVWIVLQSWGLCASCCHCCWHVLCVDLVQDGYWQTKSAVVFAAAAGLPAESRQVPAFQMPSSKTLVQCQCAKTVASGGDPYS